MGGVERYRRGSRQRLTNLAVPEQVIAEIDKSHVAPVTVHWSAPRDGIVLERSAVEGMRANPGDVLFRIADISVVWALVDVAERDLGSITVGQPVTIRPRSFSGRTFSGKIAVIYPQVNREPARPASGSNSPTPTSRCCPTCTSMPRSTPADARAGAGRAGRAR